MTALQERLFTTVRLREGKPGEEWATVLKSPEIPRSLPGQRVDLLVYHLTFRRKNRIGGAVRFRVKVEDGVSAPVYSREREPNYPNLWTSATGVIDISSLTGETITVSLEAKGDAYQCYGFSVARQL